MFHLFDVNALIALEDTRSAFYPPLLKWMLKNPSLTVATSPITENGFLRIFGHPNYPGGPGSVVKAAYFLEVLKRHQRHIFLPDDLSILDTKAAIDLTDCTSKQLTDLYLLALAKHRGGKFATFDARVPARYVRGGSSALEIIPT